MLSVEPFPFVSVILPTFNRADMLRITLESLLNQSYDKQKYEIIVVDNNSSDHTRQIIEELERDSIVPLKYLFERRQGVHYARNTAVNHAQGEILYYTDDDMIADVNLLKEIVRPFSYDVRVAAVTGRVLPKWQQEPPRWVLDLCVNYLLSLQDKSEHLIVSPHDCGIFSCHQALRKDALVRVGGYNPGNTAGDFVGDHEIGLNTKLKTFGYLFSYINSSVTYHSIPPERMTQQYLNKRMANQGGCDSYTDYRCHNYTRLHLAWRILSHVKGIFVQILKVAVKLSLKMDAWRLNRARIDYFISRIKYDLRLMNDKKWQAFVLKSDWLNEEEDKAT